MGEQSIQAQTITRDRRQGHGDDVGRWLSGTVFSVLLIGALVIGWPAVLAPLATASHQGMVVMQVKRPMKQLAQGT